MKNFQSIDFLSLGIFSAKIYYSFRTERQSFCNSEQYRIFFELQAKWNIFLILVENLFIYSWRKLKRDNVSLR